MVEKKKSKFKYGNSTAVKRILKQHTVGFPIHVENNPTAASNTVANVATKDVESDTSVANFSDDSLSFDFTSEEEVEPALRQELTDEHIDQLLVYLRNTFPHVRGLQSPLVGQSVANKSMPRFVPLSGSNKFVQIVNTGDHWVCATNIFTRRYMSLTVCNRRISPTRYLFN